MALVISDRVKETTVTTGTGTVTLAGAVTGFRTFASVLSTNDTTYYAIVSSSEFEVGIGTLTASSTLTRDTVLSSSNNGLKVDFGAGSKNVFITQPADKAIFQDASGNVSGLDTDNVTEGSTNLYFTNERVDDRVGSLLVAGDNVTLAYDDNAGTLTISATEDNLSNNTTDDLAEGSTNLYYTSARANADFDTRLATKDTDDLSEGTNLYYTNERVDDRVSNLLEDGTGISFTYDDSNNVLTPTVTLSPFSTTNLSEGTNLYFTNERVDDRVANLLTAGSNITLTYDDTAGTLTIAGIEDDLSNNDTDDLSEGATNLYYTDERVDDRVSALVQNGTGISWSYNDVSGTLTPTVSLSAFSTSDLSEGTNLYYTTARFDSAFSGKSTSDLSEGTNLYYTTARFDTAFSGKDTDDLTEGASNLYYTDTRANSAIDARVTQSFVNALNVTAAGVQANSVALGTDTTGNYIATIAGTANKISVTGSGSESATVTLTLPDDVQIANDLTVAGDLTVNGATTTLGTTNLEVSDNLFELNAGLTTAPVNDSGMLIQRGTSDNAIFMWDESADKFTLGTTTSDATVTGNITITTGSLVANLEGNVTGNVTGTVSSLSNHDTGDLAEGSNLYYTDARSRAAISASGDISYDSSTGVISFTQATAPVTSVNTQTGAVVLDTDDISEGASNLYYTAARFNSAFAAKSTSDLSEGTNLYLTQERVEDYVGGMVSGNTETGIAVTYDDTNGKLNFVIDTLNQDTTGNAATATALETARNFSLTGDVTASAVSFDGTANVALSTSIAANTVGITELNVTDGTNGQVLTTDGAGNLSFSDTAGGYGDSDVESYLDGGTSTPTFASATVSGDFTVDTNRLYVDSTNDRVGIALSTPPHRFSVGSANDDGIALFDGTNDLATIFRENNNQARFSLLDTGTVKVRLSSKPSDANYINNGGNVGIGTTSPDQLLHISAAANPAIRIENTDTTATAGQTIGKIEFEGQDASTNAAGVRALIDAQYAGVGGQGRLKFQLAQENSASLSDSLHLNYGLQQFFTNGSEAMRIDSSGDVGIGGDTTTASSLNNLSIGAYADASSGIVLRATTASALNFEDNSSVTAARVYYNHASDYMAFNTAQTERLRIDSSGKLGIGTTSPNSTLHVDGGGQNSALFLHSTDTDTFITISDDDGAAEIRTKDGGALQFRTGGTSNTLADSTTAITIDSSQNVGIGTTSPSTYGLFTVNGSGITNHINSTSGAGGINFYEGGSGRFSLRTLNGSSGLAFYDTFNSAERIRIDSSGNVGIGTTSPVSLGGHDGVLTLFGSNATALVLKNDTSTSRLAQLGSDLGFFVATHETERMRLTSTGLGIGLTSPSVPLEVAGNIKVNAGNGSGFVLNSTSTTGIFRQNANDLGFTVGGSERMRIDSSGRFAMGNTPSISTNYILSIDSDASGQAAGIHFTHGTKNLYLGYIATTATDNAEMWNAANGYLRFATNNSERMRISSGGVVNINHTSGALNNDKFSVKQANANTSYAAALWNSASGSYQTILSIGTGTSYTHRGGIHYDATGGVVQYLTTSDSRLKTETGDADGLTVINALRPIKFTWNETGNEQQGFFAQEVQEIVPSAVAGVEDEDDYLSMDYSRLVTPLVKAVQELSAKVEALEAQLQGN